MYIYFFIIKYTQLNLNITVLDIYVFGGENLF